MKPSAPTDRWYAGSRPAQLIEPTFGLTLHELVKPVIGFRITTSDGEVTQLVNISHEADTASVSQDKYHNKRDSAVFLLAAGEFVKSLCFFKDEARLTALCFVTNLRKSRWFGHPAPDDRYGSISAPEGQYIHALYGEEQGTACENVGVVKWKLSASHVEPCSNPLTTPQSGGAFHSHALDLRAIVVRCDVLVKSITVLSRAEYRRVLTVGWDVQYHADEHILELFGGEKITGVEWTCDQEHMQALRFHTSHRTSAWFGGCGTEPTTVIRAAEDAFIIGFKGHKDDEAVTELYAIQYSEKGQGERSDRQVQESADDVKEEGASSVTTKGSMTEDEEVQPSWELLVELSGH